MISSHTSIIFKLPISKIFRVYPKLFFVLILFSSCASFHTKSITTKLNLTKTLNEFNSSYELIPSEHMGQYDPLIYLPDSSYHILKFLLDTKLTKLENYDDLSFSLKAVDEKYLTLTVYSNYEILLEHDIKGKLKRDGFFYLDRYEWDCMGFPYLLGGCYHKRFRIGMTHEKNLLVQVAEINKGALFFLFIRGYSYNSIFIYERIPNKV